MWYEKTNFPWHSDLSFTFYPFRFIIPVSMIVCNDVWAYIFGFFLGRTPLIQLSPKKTWEGFIGGGVATIIFGLCVSNRIESPEFL